MFLTRFDPWDNDTIFYERLRREIEAGRSVGLACLDEEKARAEVAARLGEDLASKVRYIVREEKPLGAHVPGVPKI